MDTAVFVDREGQRVHGGLGVVGVAALVDGVQGVGRRAPYGRGQAVDGGYPVGEGAAGVPFLFWSTRPGAEGRPPPGTSRC